MIEKLAAAAAVLLAVWAAPCQAAPGCADPDYQPGLISFSNWNPINPAVQEATFRIHFRRQQAGAKSFRVIFVDSNSNATPLRIGTTSGPRYQVIEAASGAVISFPAGTQIRSKSVPQLVFTNGGQAIGQYKLRVLANNAPVEDFIGGAVFSEPLKVTTLCILAGGQVGATDQNGDQAVRMLVTIPRLVSIVTAAPSTIDFGNFTTTTQQAQVTVKSTSPLKVTASTLNNGKMVLTGAVSPYPVNSVIPYAMKFNNKTIVPGQTTVNEARAGVTGSNYPLQLTLTGGTPAGKLAGAYSDTITLTITPGT